MSPGAVSRTAQRVAAQRLTFARLPAPTGDPEAEDRLARDVAADLDAPPEGDLRRYLEARTAFFDRVVVNGLGRGVTQVVVVGAGYDGRPLRYARPGVRWWEVDTDATVEDKRARLARLGLDADAITWVPWDLEAPGLADRLVATGFDPDGLSVVYAEGVVSYLHEDGVATLLAELRALAAPGTRAALSVASSVSDGERRQRLAEVVADLGEPLLATISAARCGELAAEARWRMVPISERAAQVGFAVLAPVWEEAPAGRPVSAGVVARYNERMLSRAGGDGLAAHVASAYGVKVRRIKELDLGVHRLELAGGDRWIARVMPAARPLPAVEADAELLEWLEAAGFPAERLAVDDPVSSYLEQGVLLTKAVVGRPASMGPGTVAELAADTASVLGDLLGTLHGMEPGCPAARRPGGAWHHLAPDAAPAGELDVMAELLDRAAARVAPGEREAFDELYGAVAGLEGCAGLPHALVHPDLVASNLFRFGPGAGAVTVIDWSGAGWGPRVLSLGCTLWTLVDSAAQVDAAAAAYRRHVRLEPEELDCLDLALCHRPVLLNAWAWVTGRRPLGEVVAGWRGQRAQLLGGVARIRSVLAAPPERE